MSITKEEWEVWIPFRKANQSMKAYKFLKDNPNKAFKNVELAKLIYGDDKVTYQKRMETLLRKLKEKNMVLHKNSYWIYNEDYEETKDDEVKIKIMEEDNENKI